MAHVYTRRTPFPDNFFPTEALVDFFILRFPGDPVGGWKPGDEKNDGAVWGYELVQKGSAGKTCHSWVCAGNGMEMIRRSVGTFVKKWTVRKLGPKESWENSAQNGSWEFFVKSGSWETFVKNGSWENLVRNASWETLAQKVPWELFVQNGSWELLV